ncbi:MAG: helix-turn-helix domain-containing protein [Phycisphaera sp.]|nr:helix-turn-helix domain-containing protein [Phycisphaera sp.]
MSQLLTTRDLAEAIGVSESSLRRWVDDGVIQAFRTAGGHRRITLDEAIRFIRESGTPLVNPVKIGLPTLPRDHQGYTVDPTETLLNALMVGDDEHAIGIVMTYFLSGKPIATLFDGPIRATMTRLGELWKHNERGILIEHRATDTFIRALSRIRLSIKNPPADAPVAIGCAPGNDPYFIPTMMAACIFADNGVRDINLGPQTPTQTLIHGIEENQARAAWLSISTEFEQDQLERDLTPLIASTAKLGCQLVIGGRNAPTQLRKPAPHVLLTRTMAELTAFARGISAP